MTKVEPELFLSFEEGRGRWLMNKPCISQEAGFCIYEKVGNGDK